MRVGRWSRARPDVQYSLTAYRSIIERALASGLTFVPFTTNGAAGAGRIHLRHDVDYSLEMAREVARVNADLGVAATFFVLLRSQIYNALSPWSQRLIREIHELGQTVALHAPVASEAVEIHGLEAALRGDFEFFCRTIIELAPVVSWHNPPGWCLDQTVSRPTIGGLVNVYGSRFTRDSAYVSDSNMRHSVEALLSLAERPPERALHLLLHPCNWVAGGSSMADVFEGVWPYIIREREHEVRGNAFYAAVLPEGMPAPVLETFAGQWRRAVEDKGK